jgi:cation diffusion facilitator CzcD-associated flavoprotein CzcO
MLMVWQVVHTAGWPDNYWEEEWKGENVVVIGSGASSVQLVPTMQPHVKRKNSMQLGNIS